ncbi:uncharacterized protein AMSG_05117 [Thecamonas trahens ATCC 50062]|uniref:Mechanosensitive ion channel MscS domain-containing protein n=1 Tax=Thecamonas trahens ATCC 50062 TaxID=461836 RepID=A0A0L0D9V9_THETB|nr:hypothetical protein AMSG_05117 [Thecamonas trahens ATCC 50062]KNC49142.1 hypothetical protein AMSG_05117 [Thecamonas trahens ATCC 50062]|eukprot:XP_013758167.1 hypothetical protein AMSG_05117 [Thecamonas trahens ATCC 50062]
MSGEATPLLGESEPSVNATGPRGGAVVSRGRTRTALDTSRHGEREGARRGQARGGWRPPSERVWPSLRRMSPIRRMENAEPSVPVLGIPLRLNRRQGEAVDEHEESDNYAELKPMPMASPMVVVVALAMMVVALAGVVVSTRRQTASGAAAYSSDTEAYLWFWAAELAGWVVIRGIVEYLHRCAAQRCFLYFWFYLVEGTQRAMTCVVWAGISLAVAAYAEPASSRAHHGGDLSTSAKVLVAVLVVFVLNIVKYACERVWLERIHADLFGKELARLVKDEELVCKLTWCRPEASDLWVTPPEEPHTHSLRKTLYALLGQALGGDTHVLDADEKRAASVARATDILTNVDTESKGFFTLDDVDAALGSRRRARRAMQIFAAPGANLGRVRVSHDDAVSAIFAVFNKRESMYRMLHDRGALSVVLHRFTGVLFWFLAAAWSGFILIFVVRPYAVGDRITLDGMPTLIVSAIHLLTTEAFSPDGRHFLIPNAKLAFSSIITSYKRSREYAMTAGVAVAQDAMTPEVFHRLEDEVVAFMADDASVPWDVEDNFMMWADPVVNGQITVSVWIGLRGVNWARPDAYLGPKTRLVLEMQRILATVGVQAAPLPLQPVKLMKQE